jgi:hypothetical protein
VSHTLKEQRRRDRVREYDGALAAARSALAVLALFVRGRESRASDETLEETFAATVPDTVDGRPPFPAAIWVALRQGDVDGALHLLITLSTTNFVMAAHEQLDAGYRLTSVEENRGLPEVDRLESQLARFLHVPVDVIAVITGWGPDDPRTAAEIDALLEPRFGAVTAMPASAATAGRPVEHPAPSRSARAADSVRAADSGQAATPRATAGGLTMSAEEFNALLKLSPEQHRVLATLVRQTTITINARA